MKTRNEIIKELTESFRKELRDGHDGARRIAERVATELIALDNDYQLKVATLKAQFDADVAALHRELASTEQDFEDGLKALRTKQSNVVTLPTRPQ
jgi:hypothetical protein